MYFGIVVTPWKLVGFLGALMFAVRWVLQAWATRRAGRPIIPRSFWVISLAGSAMVTSYFIWGKNDAVGVLTNLLPASRGVLQPGHGHQVGRGPAFQCLISACCRACRPGAPRLHPFRPNRPKLREIAQRVCEPFPRRRSRFR